MLSVLRSVQGPTAIKPGCRCCRIYEEDGHDEAVLYMECWNSAQEFERHIRSDMYRRVLEAMELSRMPPELQYHHVTETQGIELVAALRGGVVPGGSIAVSPRESLTANQPAFPSSQPSGSKP